MIVELLALAAMKTPWTDLVSPTLPHAEYPRPQLVRKDWVCLNGPWEFSIGEAKFDRKILVPFPVESQLSGIAEMVPEGQSVFYRRLISAPKTKGRTLLHFGAVDWRAKVRIDGRPVCEHTGGYTPFSADVTDFLADGGQHALTVEVFDPTDANWQPRGKQVRKPEGIWYTPTTGIWQSVWMEQVPGAFIKSVQVQSRLDGRASLLAEGTPGLKWKAKIKFKNRIVANVSGTAGKSSQFRIAEPRPWSPDAPNLYTVELQAGADNVTSYFAVRELGKAKNADGQHVLTLNGKPIFQFGPLDQGFWPDGLYTAPTHEAMVYDLKVTKGLGMNTIRKHVKVEPATWYAACDRLGILVWQDMPSGDGFIGGRDPDLKRTPESAANYHRELQEMIQSLRFFPSVCTWVVFNEGWGQFDTAAVAAWTKKCDPSRWVNSASGWTDRSVGDMHDVHIYPGPGRPAFEAKRAIVLGEFGGLGYKVEGHTWLKDGWGYRSFASKQELNKELANLLENLAFLRAEGLSAAIYTQTTDVETEINGLMTYDRQILKVDAKMVRRLARKLSEPLPTLTMIAQTSERQKQVWRHTRQDPGPGWFKPDFAAADWARGKGGFGTEQTPGAVVGTRWEGAGTIWLRRAFSGEFGSQKAYLKLHHDEDVEVYLDGELVYSATGWTTGYRYLPIKLSAAIRGRRQHVLAVKCTQTNGGQFIDVGVAVGS